MQVLELRMQESPAGSVSQFPRLQPGHIVRWRRSGWRRVRRGLLRAAAGASLWVPGLAGRSGTAAGRQGTGLGVKHGRVVSSWQAGSACRLPRELFTRRRVTSGRRQRHMDGVGPHPCWEPGWYLHGRTIRLLLHPGGIHVPGKSNDHVVGLIRTPGLRSLARGFESQLGGEQA